jgi:hypothetical protein
MTCPEINSISAYVLGALDVEERLDTERHLDDCESCRGELLRLGHLPGLLQRVTLDDILSPDLDEVRLMTVPISLPEVTTPARRLASRPRSSPPRSRWPRAGWPRALVMAAAAAALVVGGGLAGGELLADRSDSVTWSATNMTSGIDATVRPSREPWGTDIELSLADLPAGQRCKLVVHARSGESETAGWWGTGYASEAKVPASTSIGLADIDHVHVVRSDNTVLATLTGTSR